ncbi:hypothetical protein [Nocardia anaemiae]|uniref:hypothetical protein n=1 Tax=Nocardia anaemiae TaxID=263910 RepID=UPI0007A47639|nr:hypothetical protein [Nocardia anaemiae]
MFAKPGGIDFDGPLCRLDQDARSILSNSNGDDLRETIATTGAKPGWIFSSASMTAKVSASMIGDHFPVCMSFHSYVMKPALRGFSSNRRTSRE